MRLAPRPRRRAGRRLHSAPRRAARRAYAGCRGKTTRAPIYVGNTAGRAGEPEHVCQLAGQPEDIDQLAEAGRGWPSRAEAGGRPELELVLAGRAATAGGVLTSQK